MIPTTFERLLESLSSARRRHESERAALEAEYRAVLFATFRGVHPTRRSAHANLEKAIRLDGALARGVLEAYDPLAREMVARQRAEVADLEALLEAAAERHAPRPTALEVWYRWREFRASTHRSTCRGEAYARASAERAAAKARAWGIEARVVRRPTSWGEADFEVWVATDEAGAEAIARRPESLREFLRSCWGAGVNPRVYDPFLPVGLEERLGLDFFGREVRGSARRALVPWAPPWVWPILGPLFEIPQVPPAAADERGEETEPCS